MSRSLLALAAAVVVSAGCSGEKPAATTAAATPAAPPVLPAVKAIYESYAQAPSTFARLPHLSRFYVEDNQRKDAACATDSSGAACRGDRFACLEREPSGAGSVVDARIDGEQPNVSASVKMKLSFGATATAFDVDVVFEDGAWKIDQVRCP